MEDEGAGFYRETVKAAAEKCAKVEVMQHQEAYNPTQTK